MYIRLGADQMRVRFSLEDVKILQKEKTLSIGFSMGEVFWNFSVYLVLESKEEVVLKIEKLSWVLEISEKILKELFMLFPSKNGKTFMLDHLKLNLEIDIKQKK